MRISLGCEPAAARHSERTGIPHRPEPRIRILLVVEPEIDGVFRHVEGLTHFLLSKGQEVHLAYSDRRASEGLGRLLALVRKHDCECLNLRVGNGPEPRDVVAIGISASGRSANVIQALRVARELGIVAAALIGRDGGDLVGLADPHR